MFLLMELLQFHKRHVKYDLLAVWPAERRRQIGAGPFLNLIDAKKSEQV